MDVSKNRCTPKSSILNGFSSINHPFWGTPIFGNTRVRFVFGRVCFFGEFLFVLRDLSSHGVHMFEDHLQQVQKNSDRL